MAAGTIADRLDPGSGGGSSDGAGDNGGGRDGTPSGNAVPQRAYVTGMTIALAAILMFFMALVSAYIVRQGMPNSGWLPLTMLPRILWVDTFILVASSFTLDRARRFLMASNEGAFRRWWKITAVLGVGFLGGQFIAWRDLAQAGIYLATNPSSSFFYVLTAAHGLHILGGVAALVFVILRPARKLEQRTATEIVAMYWHFMDGLWIFLFLLLLLGRR